MAIAQAPIIPPAEVGIGAVKTIRELLPGWPRLVPVKLMVALFCRVRLANVRSTDVTVPPPVLAVIVLAPWARVTAPKVSVAAVVNRPV